jgi:hypothetical protein
MTLQTQYQKVNRHLARLDVLMDTLTLYVNQGNDLMTTAALAEINAIMGKLIEDVDTIEKEVLNAREQQITGGAEEAVPE